MLNKTAGDMTSKLLGNLKFGLPFILSAPAGTGKTTLVEMLVKEFDCVVESISYTTRPPRPHEINGRHYHFVSVAEFERMIAANVFLEYVKLYGHYYGTSRLWLQQQQNMGKHVILVIDTQGAMILRESYAAAYIFIMPPSLEELRRRLMTRKTEKAEEIQERLSCARREFEDSQFYDYHIINDNLAVAYDTLKSILIAEEHRTIHRLQQIKF